MNKEQKCVEEFHKTFNLPIRIIPDIPPLSRCSLRLNLIEEELEELREAIIQNNLISAADALGDLLYVVYGAGLEFGLDLEPVFAEIHRSNMTKVGGTLREDGKLLKPATYEPPKFWWLE